MHLGQSDTIICSPLDLVAMNALPVFCRDFGSCCHVVVCPYRRAYCLLVVFSRDAVPVPFPCAPFPRRIGSRRVSARGIFGGEPWSHRRRRSWGGDARKNGLLNHGDFKLCKTSNSKEGSGKGIKMCMGGVYSRTSSLFGGLSDENSLWHSGCAGEP